MDGLWPQVPLSECGPGPWAAGGLGTRVWPRPFRRSLLEALLLPLSVASSPCRPMVALDRPILLASSHGFVCGPRALARWGPRLPSCPGSP